MKSLVIKGQERKSLGKKDAKALRAAEKAPAVLYGGETPIHFSVDFAEMRNLVYTPNVYLIDLDIDGTTHKAIMQDIQWHPVDEQILHVDFLRISDDKPVKMEVPINVTGFAKGIKAGGKLNTNLRRLKVKALPVNMPDAVDIDITELDLGEGIKVADLNVENVELLDAKSNVVVSVAITRAAKSALGAAKATEGDSAGEE